MIRLGGIFGKTEPRDVEPARNVFVTLIGREPDVTAINVGTSIKMIQGTGFHVVPQMFEKGFQGL